jgi:anaerobic dimethyl sulfoxide reductase subunit A
MICVLEEIYMSEKSFLTNLNASTSITRRSFMKWSAALGGTAAAVSLGDFGFVNAQETAEELAAAFGDTGRMVRTCCPAHNCGGRCMLVAHVNDGVITRLSSDDREYDEIDDPRLLACARGRPIAAASTIRIGSNTR